MRKGIDVSQWQGNIDFDALAKSKQIDFAIPRCGYGSTIDPYFIKNVKGFQEAGIAVDAVYHFIYAINAEQARQNAQNAISFVQKAGLPKGTRIWCDLEYDTIDSAAGQGVVIDKSVATLFASVFCSEVVKMGYETGIYTNMDFINRFFTKELLSKYPIWLADPSQVSNYPCEIKQYSFNGRLPGIYGDVDLDVEYDTDTTEKEPEKKKSVREIAQEVISGKWSNGEERKNLLTAAGYNYDEVQGEVNNILLSKKTVREIAQEVISGKWSNGEGRKNLLTAAGYNYDEVQAEVNRLMGY